MSIVSIRRADYRSARLGAAVATMFDAVAGNLDWRGRRVLIKPNFLLPARPEQAVSTHPRVVRAVADYVWQRGGLPEIGDSPASGTIDRIWRSGGYAAAFEGRDIPVRAFDDSVPVDIGPPFGTVAIARRAMDADLVVNLAKFKTHSLMHLTLAVKNMFGCIVGLRKPEWHLRIGIDPALFAGLLVQVCRAVAPAISMIDGILAMQGQGPGKAGQPRQMGVLIASRDPQAADLAACRMVGLDPIALPTLAAAATCGLFPSRVEIDGDLSPVSDFIFPRAGAALFGTARIKRLLRAHVLQRPVVDPRRCRVCGECWRYCPAGAISPADPALAFDYDKCIRCYCCIEVCPHGALRAHDPPAGRLLRHVQRRRGRR